MNHTIGPWKIYEGMDAESILKSGWVLVVCRNNAGRIVANVNLNGGPGSKPMPCMDNVRLIAAAPDLLKALERLLELHQRHDPHYADLCEDCKEAAAAIARAKGERE